MLMGCCCHLLLLLLLQPLRPLLVHCLLQR
jgi:hypothetical protein